MAGNSIGTIFRLTTFGESHGPAIGGVIDGFPAGIPIDTDIINRELERRKPGQQVYSSPRREQDKVEILSGLFEGVSTGAPIAFIIRNTDARPADYDSFRNILRPSHADFTYLKKYGLRDHRGGGRASARETAVRVAGGALARILLKDTGIAFTAYTSAIGKVRVEMMVTPAMHDLIYKDPLRCPDPSVATEMGKLLEEARMEGDSLGSAVTCLISGVPAGLGEPVFDKLEADLAKAMMSINAASGFEFGSGFNAVAMKGSEHNDTFHLADPDNPHSIEPLTNHAGGIVAGISNGKDILFRVAFKPVATIGRPQDTLTLDGKAVRFEGSGRHDTVIAPRAVPVVEAMAALTLADHYLRQKTQTR